MHGPAIGKTPGTVPQQCRFRSAQGSMRSNPGPHNEPPTQLAFAALCCRPSITRMLLRNPQNVTFVAPANSSSVRTPTSRTRPPFALASQDGPTQFAYTSRPLLRCSTCLRSSHSGTVRRTKNPIASVRCALIEQSRSGRSSLSLWSNKRPLLLNTNLKSEVWVQVPDQSRLSLVHPSARSTELLLLPQRAADAPLLSEQ